MFGFRIIYVDGEHLAKRIAQKFNDYNIPVDLVNPKLLSRLTNERNPSSSSLPPPSSSPSQQSESFPPRDGDHIPVVLVTPKMSDYLSEMADEERSSIMTLIQSDKSPIAVSVQVPFGQMKQHIVDTFSDMALTWRFLEMGTEKDSFRLCTMHMLNFREEEQDTIHVPTLQQCLLLPEGPVLAGETMYIYHDSCLFDKDEESETPALQVTFEDGTRIPADKIAEHLHQFRVPELSTSTAVIEISTHTGQFVRQGTITIKDKTEVLRTTLLDLMNPIEFMCQALGLDEPHSELLDIQLADCFRYHESKANRSRVQKYISEWVLSHKVDQITCSHRELPTLLHMSAKYNLPNLTQSLLAHPWAGEALQTENRDRHTPDQVAAKYRHDDLAHFLALEKEVDKSSSSSSEDAPNQNFDPNYCMPDDLFNPQPVSSETLEPKPVTETTGDSRSSANRKPNYAKASQVIQSRQCLSEQQTSRPSSSENRHTSEATKKDMVDGYGSRNNVFESFGDQPKAPPRNNARRGSMDTAPSSQQPNFPKSFGQSKPHSKSYSDLRSAGIPFQKVLFSPGLHICEDTDDTSCHSSGSGETLSADGDSRRGKYRQKFDCVSPARFPGYTTRSETEAVTQQSMTNVGACRIAHGGKHDYTAIGDNPDDDDYYSTANHHYGCCACSSHSSSAVHRKKSNSWSPSNIEETDPNGNIKRTTENKFNRKPTPPPVPPPPDHLRVPQPPETGAQSITSSNYKGKKSKK